MVTAYLGRPGASVRRQFGDLEELARFVATPGRHRYEIERFTTDDLGGQWVTPIKEQS